MVAKPAERWQLARSGYECENITEKTYICRSTCQYSNWTDAVPFVNAIPVPDYQCCSGSALPAWGEVADMQQLVDINVQERSVKNVKTKKKSV